MSAEDTQGQAAATEAAVDGAEPSGTAEPLPAEDAGAGPAAAGDAPVGDAASAQADGDAPVEPDGAAPPASEATAVPDVDYLLLAQRVQADFDNFRKRAAREQSLAGDRGVARVAKELLPALDHLELALQAVEQDPAHAEIAKGFRLVQDELAKALGRVGIQAFSPQGEVFDPNQHEAMTQQPVDGAESGTVAQVYQQGYRLGDSVLRPARVVVAA